MLTVGDLTAAHCGQTFTITPPERWSAGGEVTFTDVLVRVQHNATIAGGQTLVSLGAFSGELDPTHPITLVETGA